ncbi:hypothetical protein CANARDRAFT_181131, partial [[Candida] arabinofermentans NRRL YB-2248]
MGIFNRKSSNSDDKVHLEITQADEKRLKMRSQNVHDPILNAVNEAQPFEGAANDHQRQSSLGDGILKDIFGTPIVNPDISNPSRARDERPMDTIRSFEYAITGDMVYKQQLETPQLGWRVRNDFPLFSANPYSQQNNQTQQYDEFGQPVYNNYQQQQSAPTHSFGGAGEQGVYKAPPAKETTTKKKKGLFGRKK